MRGGAAVGGSGRLLVEAVLRALMMLELELCPKYVEEHIFLLITL